MRKETAVETKHVVKYYGEQNALNDCTLTIPKGQIYGISGPNGAGKTTMLKLLTGLLIPDAGSIHIFGEDLLNNRNSLLSQIGSLIETPLFYEHLSARENLEIHLSYMNTRGFEVENALQMVGLPSVNEKAVSNYSLGMRQRLGIARAFIHRPKLLILDEPVNGLDPSGVKEMRELFLSLVAKENMTIVLSSHILNEIEQIANKICIIEHGQILCESNIKDIKETYPCGLEDYYFSIIEGGIQR